MTDKELIELAAKAAGIVGGWELDKAFIQERWYFNVPYDNKNMLSGFEWNPLRDDGDAFRLAIKLQMEINSGDDEGPCALVGYYRNADIGYIIEQEGNNPCAAARRAIVRAAAEIGKTL